MKSGCCTICLEPLIKDIQVTHCGHVFHRHCIYRWIDSKNCCPNCKQHVDASQLTHLFLSPLEIIKEVLDNPTVLESVDPDLLLKISSKQLQDDGDDDEDDDVQKKKKKNLQMELVQERIQSTALSKKNAELNQKLVLLNESIRNVQDEKSELNRKIQRCLKTAQVYEAKYFEQESKASKLSKDLYKKTKELNSTKQEIEKLVRLQSVSEHCENIKIGNVNAVNRIETRLDETQSAEERATHLKAVYDWILRENRKMLKEHAANKKNHRFDMQQQREMNEELRIRIEELQKFGNEQLAKKNRLKEQYFSLKQKFKSLAQKYKAIKAKNIKIESDENIVADIQNLSVVQTEEKEENEENEENKDEDVESILNVEPDKVDLNEGRLQTEECIFSYPGSFRQQRASTNSLFGAYRQIKTKKDNERNTNRKRNFSQFSKGDDGRGGIKTFLNDKTGKFRNNQNKRRRIVKSSVSSNNVNKRKRPNITNFFKKNG